MSRTHQSLVVLMLLVGAFVVGAPAIGGAVAPPDGPLVHVELVTNHECPYVRKHYETGNMQALQKDARGKDIVWLTVISSAPGTAAQADELTQTRQASPTALLLDPQGTVGRMYDARVTPHMYVIDPRGVLVYAGAINDRPTSRKSDVQTAQNYVRAALEAVMAGQPVKTPVTRAYGTVKYS